MKKCQANKVAAFKWNRHAAINYTQMVTFFIFCFNSKPISNQIITFPVSVSLWCQFFFLESILIASSEQLITITRIEDVKARNAK